MFWVKLVDWAYFALDLLLVIFVVLIFWVVYFVLDFRFIDFFYGLYKEEC